MQAWLVWQWEKGHHVAGYNKNPQFTQELATKGLDPAFSLAELVFRLAPPRLVVIYVPHGKPTDSTIAELIGLLQPGDLVADGVTRTGRIPCATTRR